MGRRGSLEYQVRWRRNVTCLEDHRSSYFQVSIDVSGYATLCNVDCGCISGPYVHIPFTPTSGSVNKQRTCGGPARICISKPCDGRHTKLVLRHNVSVNRHCYFCRIIRNTCRCTQHLHLSVHYELVEDVSLKGVGCGVVICRADTKAAGVMRPNTDDASCSARTATSIDNKITTVTSARSSSSRNLKVGTRSIVSRRGTDRNTNSTASLVT
mmetsp:Transcript_7163/g.18551  ORF Transcript_7163/g.18551 Transcript_7163/m.18551 type:complete len:212 (+) Transcript_7163:968-1603(+)